MIRELLNRYSHINWALADQAMVSGVNFLTGLLLARFLGISEFGVFTLLWMAVLFVNSIQLALIVSPMMSIGPKQPEREKGTYYSALVIQQAVFAVVTFFTLYLGAHLAGIFNPQWSVSHLALPLAFAGTSFQCQDFIRRYFFCHNNPVAAFWNDAISYLGQIAILMTLFFTSGLDVNLVLWVIAITSMLAIMIGMFKVAVYKVSLGDVILAMKRNWVISKWLTGSAILQWTSGNLFVLAAGALLGVTAVGALKAAQNIIGVTHILFQSLENIVPVKASVLFSRLGVEGLVKYLKQVAFLGGGVISIICILVGVFAEDLMGLIYGSTYEAYGYTLQWYAVIYLLIFICLPLRSGLRSFETTRPIFVAYVLMTVFSISFAALMVESWALSGALIGILIGQLIMVLSLCIALWKNVHRVRGVRV